MSRAQAYLDDVPLDQARGRFEAALANAGLDVPFAAVTVGLDRARGRITADPIWAKSSSPHYHAAAMDGYAIGAATTAGASDRRPVDLQIGEDAHYVDTGDPLPSRFDAVIPIELVEPIGETDGMGRATQAIRLRSGLTPWEHVRSMGEDIVATELVLPSGHEIRPIDLGALAAAGHSSVSVVRQPTVAILPTGSEMVPVGSAPVAGEIIESNSWVLAGQVADWGGVPIRWPITADDPELLSAALQQAASQHDLVLIMAGSSAGSEDYTADVVDRLGKLLVHGIAVRPGHPVILGMVEAESKQTPTPVIGIPGYPVSAALTGEIFVEPILGRWLGRSALDPSRVSAKLARKVHSTMGDEEFLRVALGRVEEEMVAVPLSRGAGVMTSLVRADGIVRIPAGVQGYQAGDPVEVQLRRQQSQIEHNLIAQGSHDLTLDWMTEHLYGRGIQLRSVNVGSLAGLVALKRGQAHFAGCHLLDPDTGEFNLGYVREYLSGQGVMVISLALRQQGLMVPAGNPRSIRGIEDLVAKELRYVNRQRGSGTRVLLDYLLESGGMDPQRVNGYERQEFTHLAVAAAVASGTADCGLGIMAAARALGLDFVPVFQERYDLVIPLASYESSRMAPLLELLQEPEFRRQAGSLPGYDAEPMGKVVARFEADSPGEQDPGG